MLRSPVDSITETDLQRLIDERLTERRVLEYKVDLLGKSDGQRKEFLADVSSFANSAGGHIIYGIAAAKGVPTDLSGIAGIHPDDEILRLESLARDGLDPRVPQLQFGAVALGNGNHALVARIPRSWVRPHMVKYQGSSRFYSRNSAGKYQMDAREIRSAFLSSESLIDRMRAFRTSRLKAIASRQTPVDVGTGSCVVLHIVPFAAFDIGGPLDIFTINEATLRPMSAQGWNHRVNFDGILTTSARSTGQHETYLQVYKNGIVEAVDAHMLNARESTPPTIPSTYFEEETISAARRYLRALSTLGLDGPVLIFVSLLGVQGYVMGVSQRFFSTDQYPIDRDLLEVPEVLVEDLGKDPAGVLRPAFDAVWNAAGWHGSTNYDDAGNWTGGR